MNILIIGNGGREHALAWKAARSTLTVNVVAPGNVGTALEPSLQNADIAATDIRLWLPLPKNVTSGLAIGLEAPLVKGVVG